MARTAEMTLLELMVLKDDISSVIEYIGKNENFQFQSKLKESSAGAAGSAGADEASAPIAGVFEDTTPIVETQYESVKEKRVVQSEITLENVKWTIQDGKTFDTSQESTYIFVPEIKTEYMIAAALPTIKVSIENKDETAFETSKVVDGVRVTVKADAGVFPET